MTQGSPLPCHSDLCMLVAPDDRAYSLSSWVLPGGFETYEAGTRGFYAKVWPLRGL